VFDSLMQLYQKGSLSIDFILDLFNIDSEDVREKLLQDVGTINDATFNDFLRGVYTGLSDKFVEQSDMSDKIAKHLGLVMKPPAEDDDGMRF